MASSKDWHLMGKRRFLKNLGKLGVSGAALQYITQDSLAEITKSPEDEIPRLNLLRHTNQFEIEQAATRGDAVEPEIEPVYYTLPREEWVVNVAPLEAAKKLSDEIGLINNNPLIKTGVATRVSGHNRERVVTVNRYTIQQADGRETSPQVKSREIQDAVPDTMGVTVAQGEFSEHIPDIPIIVREKGLEKQAFGDKYRPVSGGCEQGVGTQIPTSTLGTPAFDRDTNDYIWLTAGHNGDPHEDVFQPGSPDSGEIGFIDDKANEVHFDVATIVRTNADVEFGISEKEENDDLDYYAPIKGTLAWDTIEDQLGHMSYKLHHQGYATGRNRGYITEVTSDDQVFWINVQTEKGDSGGPHFRIENGEAYIAGIHLGGDPDAAATHISEPMGRWNLVV